jgi:hypothetical protein
MPGDQPRANAPFDSVTKLEGDPQAAAALRVCPNCGASLADRSCKLACPTPGCGFYLSCSDYL